MRNFLIASYLFLTCFAYSQNTNSWFLIPYNEQTVTEAFSNTQITLWLDGTYRSATNPTTEIINKQSGLEKFLADDNFVLTYTSDSYFRFQGTHFSSYFSNFADSTFLFNNNDFAIFIVYRPTAAVNNVDEIIYHNYNMDYTWNDHNFFIYTDGSLNVMNTVISSGMSSSLAVNKTYLISIKRKFGTSISFYLNGVLKSTYTGTLKSQNFTKKNYNMIAVGAHSYYDLAELIVAKGPLEEINRKAIESYLAKKWGL